jgi:hypothetical protein
MERPYEAIKLSEVDFTIPLALFSPRRVVLLPALLYGTPRAVMKALPGLFSPPIHVVVHLTITKLDLQFDIILEVGKKQKNKDRGEPLYSVRISCTTRRT